jgi:putative FmdB family regulatory protein
MPIYEYICRECKRKSEIITFRVSEIVTPSCRHCGSAQMDRAVSRVRVRMSEETRLDRLSDPSRLGGIDGDDPKSMARWMKNMGKEMGEDFDGDVDQIVDEAMDEEYAGGAQDPTGPAGGDD